jgi:hypothetical protein
VLFLTLFSSALASETECLTCCEEAGTPCVAELTVVAEAQDGTWVVACDGSAVFDPTSVVAVTALPGEVLTEGLPKKQLKCFADHCSFPEDLCPQVVEGVPVLGHCDTGAAFRDLDLAPTQAVVVERGVVEPAMVRTTAPTVAFTGEAVPEPPQLICSTTGEVRRTARELVDEGNDLEIAGDVDQARDRYLAAISLYPCSNLAWSSLGLLANRQGDAEGAVRALSWVVAEQPQHVGAWTALGQAHEALGQREQAVAAYERALRLHPGHAAAEQGLRRLR